MDDNLVRSILPENLYQELTELDKKTAELDTCKIPKNNEPIDILQGCVPVIPKFDSTKDIKGVKDILESILSESTLLKEQNSEEQNLEDLKNNCLNLIQSTALDLSKSMADKSNQNQLIPLQKILQNLVEVTIYNTILERNNKSKNCFDLYLDSDDYYSLVPRIKNYHLQSGIRSYDIHNVFDDIVRSVIVRKEYKTAKNVKPKHIIKYFVDLNDLSANDIGDGSVDIKTIIHSRLLTFKDVLLSVLNEIYSSANTSLLTLVYSLSSGIVNLYFNGDISTITSKKLTSTISIEPRTPAEIIEYYKSLNISLQKNLSDYFSIIDTFDIDQVKYGLIYELSNIPCTSSSIKSGSNSDSGVNSSNSGSNSNSTVFDKPTSNNKEQYKENLKIVPKKSDGYNMFVPTYWMIWTTYLNLISLLPIHWTVGFITPVGVPLKLPIIYIHLLTISIGTTNIIIWLTINGIAIAPVVMVVDGKTKSTWEVLFRGGHQLIEASQGSKSIPTGLVVPQYVDGSLAIVDTNTDKTELMPMLEDAFPPTYRMSLLNPAFLKFLNTCCNSGKLFMGLMPM